MGKKFYFLFPNFSSIYLWKLFFQFLFSSYENYKNMDKFIIIVFINMASDNCMNIKSFT